MASCLSKSTDERLRPDLGSSDRKTTGTPSAYERCHTLCAHAAAPGDLRQYSLVIVGMGESRWLMCRPSGTSAVPQAQVRHSAEMAVCCPTLNENDTLEGSSTPSSSQKIIVTPETPCGRSEMIQKGVGMPASNTPIEKA